MSSSVTEARLKDRKALRTSKSTIFALVKAESLLVEEFALVS